MNRRIIFFGLAVIVGLVMGLLITSGSVKADIKSETKSIAVTSLEGFNMEDAIINVANITGKAVVSISTEHTTKIKGVKRYQFSSPFGQDESFRRFFDDFFGDIPDREYKQAGLGSGVIIDSTGYILTNQHVIYNADKITVTLSDGRSFKGEIKGQDLRSDLAVIKINARNLPAASLGDSDRIKIGQWVVAIGNPFAFALQNPEPTVTAGVISALHRSLSRGILRDRDYNDLIQTDAAINPGNSGGPLVNLKGEVVGINVAIFSTSGGYQGVGFAIPINNAKRVISQLIEGKKILYGWLGVTVQDLSDDLAKYFGLPDKNGVLIAKVLENGPAAKAGMKEGDCIMQFDNKPIKNLRELLNAVGKSEVGRKIKVMLIRNKKYLTLDVEVGQRPEEGKEEEVTEKATENWRGLAVVDLNSESAQRFKVQEKEGVLILNIEAASPAEEAGLLPGDIILEINKQKITNVAEYKKITKGLRADVLIRTPRGYFMLKEGEKQ